MLDAPEFERWRDAADEARTAARVQAGAGGHSWACFLAEQAAQLLLKGLLHGIGAGAWGHDLVKLGREVVTTTGAELPGEAAAALRRLCPHARRVRQTRGRAARAAAGRRLWFSTSCTRGFLQLHRTPARAVGVALRANRVPGCV